MDTRYLQSFVTVVESGSFAQAARRLDLTPTAVAARIKALEDTLGLSLIKRAGRSVRPTEAGMRILDRARALLRDARDLAALAENDDAMGELRLGVFVSAMTSVLPPVLRRVYERHPSLSVFVTPGASVDLCHRVGAGELDAAIVVEPQFAIGKTVRWQAVMEEPLVVVAPAGMEGRDPHELLRTQPFIRYDRSVLGGQLADRYLRDHRIVPRQRLEMDSLLGVAALVDQGLGVALLPDWSSLWSSRYALTRIPLPGRAPVRRVGLVWQSPGARASLAETLLEDARTVFSRPPRRRTPHGD
ncbi:LysR family transcriptional regulator [Bordetella genomosp. 9]|uniref:LysR substrate-binding domain-containing protein n=1 Tax=Bordetella genomosp. 9 TaxID=1416803 RepID=UPI000A29735A|nr:LysR substrate-binding domain-containing protein [Bordetella genomosp. 9]ARP89443.1 LysR family transcriptional regulator [Bordetella genomosp. 9]